MRRKGVEKDRQTYKQTEGKKEIGRQGDGVEKDRQTDKQTEGKKEIDRQEYMLLNISYVYRR